jgi:hypothetical protein
VVVGTLASELRSIAADLAAAPRIYADANLPAGLVAAMRHELHWDVLFVLEDDDLRRASDREHYRRARELGRTLITIDRDFFDEKRFPIVDSPGVVVLSAPDEHGLLRLLRQLDRDVLRAPEARELPLAGRKIDLAPAAAE